MGAKLSEESQALWNRLVEAERVKISVQSELRAKHEHELVELVRQGLQSQMWVALKFARLLTVEELKQLFVELVGLASFSHGQIQEVRNLILSLPTDWVLANIEHASEPLLESGSDEEYRRLLELYIALNQELALRLATRAFAHRNSDVKETGQDFLEKLGG